MARSFLAICVVFVVLAIAANVYAEQEVAPKVRSNAPLSCKNFSLSDLFT
jgi:hypothetical protein